MEKSYLKIDNSFRFLKNKNKVDKNIIYLPIQIKNVDSVISCLKRLVNLKKIDIKKYNIKKSSCCL